LIRLLNEFDLKIGCFVLSAVLVAVVDPTNVRSN